MKIYLATDHAGYELKEKLKIYLSLLGYEIEDMGPYNYVATDDYPDYIRPLAERVASEKGAFGIISGKSGQGEAMCANRVKGVRAAVFYGQELPDVGEKKSDSFEIIKLAREHNDANVLSLGGNFISEDEAKFAVELFLSTKFSEDERHIRRIKKLD
ncbi:ribose-5-phosphate isomerase [Candidatus Nomurabacteria bacterium RIFCSPLOWO2_01_FULL_41_21]|uniref:Ribose-5-phosphate isomerase n=2 Tax=Candidatus Nomuraibacteriota TaxID=1752729 RepID=A0A1F6V3C8_9BACT|nr:MAG: ribose-5-phosphate isomerase [Candidatus Nomurabacteria bacterium RIFCSPHIGHO2_01_FULL_40_20]OGI88816.1 MAG: ribose-5-phosphate isomerase [Candidatus Nomurabacteria bacterium RIFCSPLOWO2_01_FULL_41_21]